MRRLRTTPLLLALASPLVAAGPAAAQEEPRRDASPDREQGAGESDEARGDDTDAPDEDGRGPPGDDDEDDDRRGPPGSGMRDQQVERMVGFLDEQLDLDDPQVEEVTAIVEEVMEKAWEQMSELWSEGGGPDRERMRDVFRDIRLEMGRRVREVLGPAQKREYDVLVERFDRRSQRWEQRRSASEDPTRYFDPPRVRKQILMAKAERALFLGPDETKAVMPYVEEVLDHRRTLQQGAQVRRRDLRNALDGGADDEEIAERLPALRDTRRFQRLELLAAQQRLRDLLTVQQEARLVAMGILD